jgi:hypothetical protein
MRPSEALEILAYLRAAYPGHRDLPDSTIELYATELLPYSAEHARWAARDLAKHERWFPSLAVLLEYVQMYEPPPPVPEPPREIDAQGAQLSPEQARELLWRMMPLRSVRPLARMLAKMQGIDFDQLEEEFRLIREQRQDRLREALSSKHPALD